MNYIYLLNNIYKNVTGTEMLSVHTLNDKEREPTLVETIIEIPERTLITTRVSFYEPFAEGGNRKIKEHRIRLYLQATSVENMNEREHSLISIVLGNIVGFQSP